MEIAIIQHTCLEHPDGKIMCYIMNQWVLIGHDRGLAVPATALKQVQ